jgi:hypothetical protein
LPDGLFKTKNPYLGIVGMENVGIIYGHLV